MSKRYCPPARRNIRPTNIIATRSVPDTRFTVEACGLRTVLNTTCLGDTPAARSWLMRLIATPSK